MSAQLYFPFIERTETDILREELAEVRASSEKALAMADNVRKGLFKRHSELAREFLKQHEQLELLQKQLDVIKKSLIQLDSNRLA